jgi:SAM-dependent methyltransferase
LNRFGFGRNWLDYAQLIDGKRIENSVKALSDFLDENNLAGKTFLDIGSGSGLSSLAAAKMGAAVYSFDYDKDSVTCTQQLREKYFPDKSDWVVERGDVLDQEYLKNLPRSDIVYSWGVLHHTGHMWQAFENVINLVNPGGKLFISIYNDQGIASKIWTAVKRFYNWSPSIVKRLLVIACLLWIWKYRFMSDLLFHINPFKTWNEYAKERGMSPWYDVIDWVGGYPFEVAKPEQVFDFFKVRGFRLNRLKTCAGGLGCNEYLFIRD